ncbi:hypothetical protein A1D50_05150 [Salmonella enterica]|uniref:Uncharacterized protein n=1 Tax=Salmonella enterica TaxID=28901 RepID=A0A624MMZ4_SALER|nr:hypothetical protein [Salmonella enterica]EBF9515076.1 hypothetical protein [Salmonella enterica subsp. enterica serovar Kingston]EDT1456479.1 hypothetical protein [Salmonella enterica subsp. enterica serovar Ramatgan]EDT4116541.1 hypothetical protein [Salmonella enterica subsp. enterica serovar Uzaramo]EDW1899135.1 hypothetical protein [Salmonella enterica subsp. enterica serovar Lingwala]EEL9728793.1 hypothetical protein [Salmonella enterica subsp. enterica serovar Infantis]
MVSMLPSCTFVKVQKCSLSNIIAKKRAIGNIEKTFWSDMYNIMALSYSVNVHWAIKCLNWLHRQ